MTDNAIYEGTAHVYQNNVNTDYILPAVWMAVSDPEIMGEHTFELFDPQFLGRVKEGDFIIGGTNFGCGSSREHAPLALKASGIRVVVAKSFARIFYRNCINIGLPVITLGEDSGLEFATGDVVTTDLGAGTIDNLTTGATAETQRMPEFMLKIFDAGGLLPAFQAGVLS